MELKDWQEQILEREGFNKPHTKGLFSFISYENILPRNRSIKERPRE